MAAYVPIPDDELLKMRGAAPFVEPMEPFVRALDEVKWLRSNIGKLLNQFGSKGECAGCHEEMYWMPRPGKRPIPYTKLGLVHFGNCPEAAQFRPGGAP